MAATTRAALAVCLAASGAAAGLPHDHRSDRDRSWDMSFRVLYEGGSPVQLLVGRSTWNKAVRDSMDDRIFWREGTGAVYSAVPGEGATSVIRLDDGKPCRAIAAAGDDLYRLRASRIEKLEHPGGWHPVRLGPGGPEVARVRRHKGQTTLFRPTPGDA